MYDKDIYNKQYYRDHREHYKECREQWAKDHREERNRDNLKYFKTEKGKIAHQRGNFNRRSLGFNPLNKPFEGSEAHHINKNDVIYMLKELHRSISHCLKTGKNMKEINELAVGSIGE